MHRDIPIHHNQGNGVGLNFPYFQQQQQQQQQPQQQPQSTQQTGEHNLQFNGPARPFYHHLQQQQPPHYYTPQQMDAESEQHQPRVYNIPIKVEGRENSSSPSPTPGQHHEQRRQQSPYQQQPNMTSHQTVQQPYPPPPPPINPHPATPPTNARQMSNEQSGRSIPIQVVKTSSTTTTAPSTDNFGPQVIKAEPVNQQSTSNISTKNTPSDSDDPVQADPNKVIPLGYTELPKQQQHQQPSAAASVAQPMAAPPTAAKPQTEAKVEPKQEPKKVEESKQTKAAETPYDHVKEILDDLDRFKSQVHEFDGSSAEDKGYKWLDEMLTLCVLRLDCIEINGDEKLRKYRKDAINTANQVFAILEEKVTKNNKPEITGVVEVVAPATNDSGVTDSSEAKTSKKIKIKKKKEETKKDSQPVGEEKEKKKFFGFGRSKSSSSKRKSGDGADSNNNLKNSDDTQSTASSERTSDSTNSSTVTLQGKETPV